MKISHHLRKILFTTGLIISIFILSACTGKPSLPEGWTTYKNENLNFTLNYPQTYKLEEKPEGITIYHFKEQPVPYFTVTVSDQTTDTLIKSVPKVLADKEIEKNNLQGRGITTYNDQLKADIETYYFENAGKTYYFSCYNDLYQDICSTFDFIK